MIVVKTQMKEDHPAVIKAKALGGDFLNSLLELDVMNAGEAATAMAKASRQFVDTVATAAALQSQTKEGITDKTLNAILDEMLVKPTGETVAAPGNN